MQRVSRFSWARPATEADLPNIYDLLSSDEAAATTRFRSSPPNFETFAATAWDDVLIQWAIYDHRNRFVGVIVLAGADLVDGVVWLSLARRSTKSPVLDSLRLIDGLCIALDHLWRTWPVRIVSAETTLDGIAGFERGEGSYFSLEGCLRSRRYVDGQYSDVHLLSMFRRHWDSAVEPRWRQLCGSRQHPNSPM